ncbi:trace amine-associated receptor 13c-like [Leuresthes tenuis]|uniref:trace amine-associated receptor 13c-like n=1 Tax=Leuresthes tenuis TaxID=355514 RepID=UPI003B50BA3B
MCFMDMEKAYNPVPPRASVGSAAGVQGCRCDNCCQVKSKRPRSVSIIIYTTLPSISVLTVTLNLLVIISISHFKQLHTPTNLLLLSLAFSDFFVGFLIVFQIFLIDGCWYLGDLMCILYYIVDYAVTCVSIETMMLISIDRYVAICYPLHYHGKVTLKRVKICVSVCWSFSFLFTFCLINNVEISSRANVCYGKCAIVLDYFIGVLDILLIFAVPVSILIVLYLRVFVVAVSQARAMRSHLAAVTLQSSGGVNVKKSELKAARTLGVIVAVFLTCLLPYFCISLNETQLSAAAADFFMCLFYFNSCFNPLIYALLYPWFRKSVKLILTLQILKIGSCQYNIL